MKFCNRWIAFFRPSQPPHLKANPYTFCTNSRRNHGTGAVHSNATPRYVAIIGSGPAGFYAARKLLALLDDVVIDMYEQLPVPFGLVRFGVAPDHPEVKNCQDTFAEVAESPRFNFIGNVHIGPQLPIEYLIPHYHALLFAYGASKDRELGIRGEKDGKHIYSARAFVGWYNGLPEYHDLNPDLTVGEDAVIVGQGNVALDVARTLLNDVDALRKTDITDYALEKLSKSRIKNIHIVGRRGPVQAAFTIKEVREMMQLSNTSFNPIPDTLFPPDLAKLPRPQKRLLELLKQGAPRPTSTFKSWALDFLLSPQSIDFSITDPTMISHLNFTTNRLAQSNSPTSPLLPASKTARQVTIPAQTLFRSIGYKSEPLPGLISNGIPFDTEKGIFPNDGFGRIVSKPIKIHHIPQGSNDRIPVPISGLYCAGWVKRGPTGVIASTMTDAFITAEAIASDLKGQHSISSAVTMATPSSKRDKRFTGSAESCGWTGVKELAKNAKLDLKPVTWSDWKKIDMVERQRGKMNGGKPREKIVRIEEMLTILD